MEHSRHAEYHSQGIAIIKYIPSMRDPPGMFRDDRKRVAEVNAMQHALTASYLHLSCSGPKREIKPIQGTVGENYILHHHDTSSIARGGAIQFIEILGNSI